MRENIGWALPKASTLNNTEKCENTLMKAAQIKRGIPDTKIFRYSCQFFKDSSSLSKLLLLGGILTSVSQHYWAILDIETLLHIHV